MLSFDMNFIFYCSESLKFSRSTFARSIIFKFEISAILKIYFSEFWPPSHITRRWLNEINLNFKNRREINRQVEFYSFSRWINEKFWRLTTIRNLYLNRLQLLHIHCTFPWRYVQFYSLFTLPLTYVSFWFHFKNLYTRGSRYKTFFM